MRLCTCQLERGHGDVDTDACPCPDDCACNWALDPPDDGRAYQRSNLRERPGPGGPSAFHYVQVVYGRWWWPGWLWRMKALQELPAMDAALREQMQTWAGRTLAPGLPQWTWLQRGHLPDAGHDSMVHDARRSAGRRPFRLVIAWLNPSPKGDT